MDTILIGTFAFIYMSLWIIYLFTIAIILQIKRSEENSLKS